MRIDRCYCCDVTFAKLAATAAQRGMRSLEELRSVVAFGSRCTLCHPYVRRMLRTGETVFSQILTEEDEPPPQ
jgi:bacterioferritin-associated ferredoxin